LTNEGGKGKGVVLNSASPLFTPLGGKDRRRKDGTQKGAPDQEGRLSESENNSPSGKRGVRKKDKRGGIGKRALSHGEKTRGEGGRRRHEKGTCGGEGKGKG